MTTASFSIHWARGEQGQKALKEGASPPIALAAESPAVPARVARLVGLALRIDTLIRSGQVRDLAQVASLAGFTRARASQIADLRLLAPDIAEELLHLNKPARGREPLTERHLRPMLREPDWTRQRAIWNQVKRLRLGR